MILKYYFLNAGLTWTMLFTTINIDFFPNHCQFMIFFYLCFWIFQREKFYLTVKKFTKNLIDLLLSTISLACALLFFAQWFSFQNMIHSPKQLENQNHVYQRPLLGGGGSGGVLVWNAGWNILGSKIAFAIFFKV